MRYELKLTKTDSGAGFFCCTPESLPLKQSVQYLKEHPFDDFMHRHVLSCICALDKDKIEKLIVETGLKDKLFRAILYEACLNDENFYNMLLLFEGSEIESLAESTPLINIRSSLMNDRNEHFKWIKLFKKNMLDHEPVKHVQNIKLPCLFNESMELEVKDRVHIRDLHKAFNPARCKSAPEFSNQKTAEHARQKLEKINIFADVEMRHIASLSPIALLRKWRLDFNVINKRNRFSFSGIQTSYGKGLSLDQARASCLMEIVERYSSFTGFKDEKTTGYIKPHDLIYSTYSSLKKQKIYTLNPNELRLETDYRNEPLYWIKADRQTGSGLKPVMIPAQSVFLFCNLDEISLFSGLDSTGLASGNSMAGAKLAALLEAIERDAEAVSPFDLNKCFRLKTDDPEIGPLLADYISRGIYIQFQDITPLHGVCCYKCFVVDQNGNIIKGTSANLSSRKAIISALTETPYPYPQGPPSMPCPENLPYVDIDNLPDYSTHSPESDLELLESVLTLNKYFPVYVDLTREDLNLPVVKALVPGLEITTDFDRFSRASPRLFFNYMNAAIKQL